jgi:hypothetical protein
VADPEISKRKGALQKGEHPPPEIEKNSRILGLKPWVLLTFDGKFRVKREGGGAAPSESATEL